MKPHLLAAVILCVLIPPVLATAQTTYYVDDNGPGDPGPGDPTLSDPLEDGSPAHPFDAIQEGIDAATGGDTVLVRDGTYTGTGNRNLNFGGRAITVQSENGADVTIIDCESAGYGFVFVSGETTTSAIEGFTIRNASGWYGGGVWCYESSPTISSCTITDSTATVGGGIYCDHGSPAITGCAISDNTAYENGGGIYCFYSSPEITGCTISGNTAIGTNWPAHSGGGGIYCDNGSPTIMNSVITGNSATYYGGGIDLWGSSATISLCTISGNSSGGNGGGVFAYGGPVTMADCTISGNSAGGYSGGGVFSYGGPVTIADCTISGNTSAEGGGGVTLTQGGADMRIVGCAIVGNTADSWGGGVYCLYSSPEITYSMIRHNSAATWNGGGIHCSDGSPAIANCTISGNSAGNLGGGINCWSSSSPDMINCTITGNEAVAGGGINCEDSSPTLTNCTVADNLASAFGGGIYCFDGTPTLSNCILWGDSPNEIYIVTGAPTAEYCDVQGGTGEPWCGAGCIDADPSFIYAVGGDYRLRPGSPCIDAATSLGAPAQDMDGRPRYDDPMTANTGSGPSGGYYDIGVHEFKAYYVNGDPAVGDEGYDGLEPVFNPVSGHGPELTIQAGINDAGAGDVVSAAPWTYTGAGNKSLDYGGKAIALLSESGAVATIIDCEGSGHGFYFHLGEEPSSVVQGFTITNGYGFGGGGIECYEHSSPTITNCVITANRAFFGGGGIECYKNSSPTITNCTITDNSAAKRGGGIYCYESKPTITNCTISGNTADESGGGISCWSIMATMTNCILWGNAAPTGHEIFVGSTGIPSTLTVRYSDVQGGAGEAYVESGCTLDIDGTDIDEDPLFVSGLLHGYYLSQTASGQGADSPCLDAGSDTAAALGLGARTTRTDGADDAGQVDMGYHAVYPLYITDVAWDQVGVEVDLAFTTMLGGDYVVEAADADAYADGLVYTTIATVLGAAQGTTAVSDDVGASPLTHAFRFYRVRRTDLDAMSRQTAAVFEMPINAAATAVYFISTPLVPDPDHNSVAAVFGEGAARQVTRTNFTVSDLDENNGAISRMRNASGTYSVLAGSAFTIEPGIGYELYVGLGFLTDFKLRLTGYVPEASITVPLTKENNQAVRWMGYSLPRTIKLSELGLVAAVTPLWAPTNKVRLLPPGSPGWFNYQYDTTGGFWYDIRFPGTPSDPDLLPGMGIVFIRAGFDNLTDELVLTKWYLYPPNTW